MKEVTHQNQAMPCRRNGKRLFLGIPVVRGEERLINDFSTIKEFLLKPKINRK